MRSGSSRASLIAIMAASIAPLVFAGNNLWTPIGPDGGVMTVIATDPTSSSVLYAGAQSGGIWKSTDAGASWKAIGNASLIAATVRSIAISPSHPTTVYVAADLLGVERSTDGGATFAPMNIGLVSGSSSIPPQVHDLAIDPAHSSVVYAGTRAAGSSTGGVFKTTDGGAHWKSTNSGLPTSNFFEVDVVRIDPADSTDVFVATEGSGVYRSTDSGGTWKKYCDDKLDGQSISDLDLFPDTDTVFALSDGLYQSSSTAPSGIKPELNDFQQSFWHNVTDALVRLEMAYPGSLKHIFENRNRSSPTTRAAASALPRLYLGSLDNGMALSTDGGSNWSLINNGLHSLDFEAIGVDSQNENVVYTGGRGDGIYKTTNGGASWAASSHGLLAASVPSLAVAPSNPSVVFAGLSYVGGVRKSTDGGATWAIENGTPDMLRDLNVTSIGIDSENSSIVYITAGGYVNAVDFVNRAYKSTDGGAHWTEIDGGVDQNNPIIALALSRSNSSVLFANGYSGLYKSTDTGASWKSLPSASSIPNPQFIAIDPTSSSTVYAATYSSGLYRSTDGGATWGDVNNDGGSGFLKFGAVRAITVDPTHPSTVYIGVDGHAVWKTTDGGAHWTSLTAGLRDESQFIDASPDGIVIDPADPKTLYLAATGSNFASADPVVQGAFVSHDSGNSWSPMSSGLTNLNATALAIAPNGANSTLFMGTQGAGVQAFTIAAPPKPRQAGGITTNPIRHVGPRP